ncbi:hypothetical protein [Blastococcus sp. SYSU DS0973]
MLRRLNELWTTSAKVGLSVGLGMALSQAFPHVQKQVVWLRPPCRTVVSSGRSARARGLRMSVVGPSGREEVGALAAKPAAATAR